MAIQVDPGDDAAYYVIDLIDLEQVGPPLAEPLGYLSITDFGAVGVQGQDDGPAIQACITTAAATSQGVWIPQGTFYSTSSPLTITGVTIRGAGMWYSTVSGFYARFNLVANNCQFYDFAILGDTVNRDDSSPENGFNDRAGTGSRLQNIWIEHTKCGFWENGSSGWNPQTADGLVITGCRVRDTMADGFNLNGGTINSTVQNCALRYTGDDSLASWSNGGPGSPNMNDQFLDNTVQLPWRANCIAIYGGANTLIRDNVCSDTLDYPGIFLAEQFSSTPFAGTTTVQANTVLRAGGPMWGTNYGAVCLAPTQSGIPGVVLQDLSITASSFYGLQFQGAFAVPGALATNLDIQGSAAFGIQALPAAKGSATFNGVLVSGSGGLAPGEPVAFTYVRGTGNLGW
ncbi:MAG TPA: glycosyl hydrolase family 28-related protein [bacterium]|nr:glycosyl hydrolase family 28-related protein [bacterium]